MQSFSLLVVIFLLGSSLSIQASLRARLSFGTPVVSDQRVVFSDILSTGVVCLSRQMGTKLCETGRDKDLFIPWKILGDKVIILNRRKIAIWDTISCEFRSVYESNSDLSIVANWGDDYLLVQALKGTESGLLCLELRTFREIWRVPSFIQMIAVTGEEICIIQGDRTLPAIGDVQVSNATISAITKKGEVMWKHPAPGRYLYDFQEGFRFESYFVAVAAIDAGVREIRCYQQREGSLVNSQRIGQPRGSIALAHWLESVSFATYGSNLLALVCYGNLDQSSNVLCQVSVPRLEIKPLFSTEFSSKIVVFEDVLIGTGPVNTTAYHIPSHQQIWKLGPANLSEVQGGFVYLSITDKDSWVAKVIEVEVKTGKQMTLFSKSLAKQRATD